MLQSFTTVVQFEEKNVLSLTFGGKKIGFASYQNTLGTKLPYWPITKQRIGQIRELFSLKLNTVINMRVVWVTLKKPIEVVHLLAMYDKLL